MSVDHSNITSVRSAPRAAAAWCLLLGCLSLLAGCATQPSTAASTASSDPTERLPIDQLQKGMPADRVSAVLGSPSKINPNSTHGIVSEIWVYTRTLTGPMQQVAAEVREVPYVDPITGNMRTVQEPVFRNQHTYFTETTELLMVNGVLAEWKQRRSTASTDFR